MRFERLDLNLLVALDALLDEQSVTKAARRLNLSQPATSNALAKLRNHFSDPLIIPMGHRMVLTPFAAGLAPSVRDLLRRARDVVRSANHFDPATASRSFSLIASELIATIFIPRLVRHLACAAPNISLILIEPDAGDPVGDLDSGIADFVIVPKEFANREHPSHKLYEDRWIGAIWTGNRLIGDEMTLDQYLRSRHIVTKFGRAQWMAATSAIVEALGPDASIAVTMPVSAALPEAIVGTDLVATVPERLALPRMADLDIRVVPIPLVLPPIIEVVQWHRERSSEPGMGWMLNTLTALS
ncbi:LysR family transcriptional regulator [Sphingobium boeckii]|uniref:DNA-binding transcriptional LysR family regulator n=1 Tax=Sphingobium boeckii TaxID=1082345 RepID=A0A7W9AFZ7_9SPHN|nr:LysR family transcriptional regulator [Sphingobium boeckii]MBB5684822.1 DNA-binding transcriptional LysR family regulator [Sphingobium boeckii]